MPWGVMARRLGKDRTNLKRACHRAEKKFPKLGQVRPAPNSLQAKDPEKYAAVMESLAHPDPVENSVAAIASRVGLPRQTVEKINQELSTVKFPAKMEVRNITMDRLQSFWGTAAANALEAMTPEKFEEASLYQLATSAGIATDKLLLLRGLPTQIVRTEQDRVKLDVLAKALQVELQRRGCEIQTDEATGMVDVTYSRPWTEGVK